MERREFLKSVTAGATLSAATTGLLGSVKPVSADEPTPATGITKHGDIPYRILGRTGERVSAVGVGGYHIGVPSEAEGERIIRTAVDRGINFMDNSWDYHEGGSEIRMGKALRDGYRQKVFLMTKIDGRTRKEAARQIDQCLKRLNTDHIDLMQHHEVIRMEDPDRIFAKNGAMEAVLAAKQAGKLRFIGFTGHKDPVVHLRMLEVARLNQFHFDTVQMPINVLDAHFRSFLHNVVPVALEQGIGVLGMKPLASGAILKSGTATALECLHFAMSQPTSTVITGIDSMEILEQALTAARTFQPLSSADTTNLLNRTAAAAADGRFERFKTTSQFDATAKHPEFLG